MYVIAENPREAGSAIAVEVAHPQKVAPHVHDCRLPTLVQDASEDSASDQGPIDTKRPVVHAASSAGFDSHHETRARICGCTDECQGEQRRNRTTSIETFQYAPSPGACPGGARPAPPRNGGVGNKVRTGRTPSTNPCTSPGCNLPGLVGARTQGRLDIEARI